MSDLATQGRCMLETTATFAVVPFALTGAGGALIQTLLHRLHHHNRHAEDGHMCAALFPDFQPTRGGLRGLGNTITIAGRQAAVERVLHDPKLRALHEALTIALPQQRAAVLVEQGAPGHLFERDRGADKRSLGKVARELRRNEARLARNQALLEADTSPEGASRLENAQKAIAARTALLLKAERASVSRQTTGPDRPARAQATRGFSVSKTPGPHMQALWNNPQMPRVASPGVSFDGFRCDIRRVAVEASGDSILWVNSYGLALRGQGGCIVLPAAPAVLPRHIWTEC